MNLVCLMENSQGGKNKALNLHEQRELFMEHAHWLCLKFRQHNGDHGSRFLGVKVCDLLS